MEMRGGFMRGPRERVGLMRPLVPLRGRGPMGMERMRLGPPLRPGLMRGGPPVPPFVGRGMIPPHARPRGMGPVMLPRPPIPPPGPLGPLGPRGLMPRPMLPPRPLGPDAANLEDHTPNTPVNGTVKGAVNQTKNVKEGNTPNKTPPVSGQNRVTSNTVVNKNVKLPNQVNKGNQGAGQIPKPAVQPHVQNVHHPQPHPQNAGPHLHKHLHPIQPQMPGGGPQPLQHMQHQQALRGRNGMNLRNRAPGIGRGGLMNNVPVGPNRGNMMMNRGGPNLPPRGGGPPLHGRGNPMMGGPPPPAPYSSPPSSYGVPPPIAAPQGPVKRGGPPMGAPPIMQPKRIRYDAPLSANGYGQYPQQAPPPQGMYSSYDAPPPPDVYNGPTQVNAPPAQGYNSDYNNYPGPQHGQYSGSPNAPYSSYNNGGGYSSYSAGGYDSGSDYPPVGPQQMNAGGDPYGYAPQVDSYGYSNYSNQQSGYDDYSGGYLDGGYAPPVQDPSYGQSVGTYGSYSY